MTPTGRCIQYCITRRRVYSGDAVVVCVFADYFRSQKSSISVGRPDWTTHRFNIRARTNMKVRRNESPYIGLSVVVTNMGIGDHRWWLWWVEHTEQISVHNLAAEQISVQSIFHG